MEGNYGGKNFPYRSIFDEKSDTFSNTRKYEKLWFGKHFTTIKNTAQTTNANTTNNASFNSRDALLENCMETAMVDTNDNQIQAQD